MRVLGLNISVCKNGLSAREGSLSGNNRLGDDRDDDAQPFLFILDEEK